MLQRMLDDRAPSVESVKTTGSQLVNNTGDKKEKEQLEAELDRLAARWNKLQEHAAARQALLDSMIQSARDYHEKLIPFLEWLENTEKKLTSSGNISTEPNVINQQLTNDRMLEGDIKVHKPDLDNVVLLGSELLKHATGKVT